MTKAEALLDLQDIDSVIDRLTRRLTEIKASLHETEELIAARSALRAAQEDVTLKRGTRKDLELSDASLETRITQAEQRMYSGLVKNPKELLDLQNDIASLKRQKSKLDDQLFAAMLALEEAEHELETCTRTDARIKAEWLASQGDLAGELTQLEHDLAEKTGEQAAARVLLSASDLATYDQLRRRKGGVVVVEMENNNLCGSCKVRVPAHVLQQLSQAEHTTRCPNCERILVRV
jgi:predicted  nucleic acid-binding Zn-ribbon protein